ncbi:MAG: hypothetical protein ACRDGM_12450, partial [bacterium]
MKIVRIERLIEAGEFPSSSACQDLLKEIQEAIRAVQWPLGSGSFTLFDQSGKKRGEGNGVKPIKGECMKFLKSRGWQLEAPFKVPEPWKFGSFDASHPVGNKQFCLEWETGNISSSHRAMNKMALGILRGVLIGGALILPTRQMYKYLTDRVGNIAELEPYFKLWASLPIENGLLAVMAIEHDSV